MQELIEKAFDMLCEDIFKKRVMLCNCFTKEDIKRYYIELARKELNNEHR